MCPGSLMCECLLKPALHRCSSSPAFLLQWNTSHFLCWQHMQTRCITVKKQKHLGFSCSRFCCFSLKEMKSLKAPESEGERERKQRLWKMFDGSRLPDGGASGISQVFVTMLINNTELSVAILPNQKRALKSTCADLHACGDSNTSPHGLTHTMPGGTQQGAGS